MNTIEDATRLHNNLIADKLIEIWQRLLQRSPISPDDDFFDLGGDSLILTRLFLDIERETGRSLPITTIYEAPTVAKLVAVVGSAAAPKFSPLVLLKEGDDGAPLFIAHGLGGNVMELTQLGKLIDSPHAVYAIQARGLDGESEPCDTVEEMGQVYVEAIREIQPRGPYFLAGYSFGGLVALEIAQRLAGAGEKIGLLAFLDGYPHKNFWPLMSRLTVMRRLAEHRLSALSKRSMREIASEVADRFRGVALNKSIGFDRAEQQESNGAPLPLPVRQVFQSALRAWRCYEPRYYPGKITFLRAERFLIYPENPGRLWRHLAEEFELHIVPGDHRGLVRDHVGSLAQALSVSLSAARVGA